MLKSTLVFWGFRRKTAHFAPQVSSWRSLANAPVVFFALYWGAKLGSANTPANAYWVTDDFLEKLGRK
jgi:hypothetical protein